MDITEKIYRFMKSSSDKNGFVPSVKQIAEEFNISDREVKSAQESLKKSGKIRITDIPRKSTVEFVD